MNRRGMWAVAALALAAASLVYAQSAEEILTKTGQTYQNLKSGRFEATTVSETRIAATDSKSQTELVVAFVKPNRFRVEYKYPNGGDWIRITDGQSAMHYQAWTKEYGKGPASPADLDLLLGTPVAGYEHLADHARQAKLVRQEPLEHVDCYVIELPNSSGGTTTYWIDKARYLVLQERTDNNASSSENLKTTTYTVASPNEPVPDSVFSFQPPPDAKVSGR